MYEERSLRPATDNLDRLQTRLNLPAPVSNPPCPPRVYKKLYQFLDRTLVSPSSINIPSAGPSTPQKSGAADRSAVNSPSKTPVTHSRKTRPDITASNKTNKRKADLISVRTDSIPPWTAPTIKHLCKKFSAMEAIPHAYVGVVSILRDRHERQIDSAAHSSKKSRTSVARISSVSGPGSEQILDTDIIATIIAVVRLVLNRMHITQHALDPESLSRAAVQEFVALGRATISGSGAIIVASKRLIDQESAEWKSMEWWHSVPRGAANKASDDDRENDGPDGSDHPLALDGAMSTVSGRNVSEMLASGRGLGAIDWLSDERRKDYRGWEAEVLRRIEHL